jgi:hypothetical protein
MLAKYIYNRFISNRSMTNNYFKDYYNGMREKPNVQIVFWTLSRT